MEKLSCYDISNYGAFSGKLSYDEIGVVSVERGVLISNYKDNYDLTFDDGIYIRKVELDLSIIMSGMVVRYDVQSMIPLSSLKLQFNQEASGGRVTIANLSKSGTPLMDANLAMQQEVPITFKLVDKFEEENWTRAKVCSMANYITIMLQDRTLDSYKSSESLPAIVVKICGASSEQILSYRESSFSSFSLVGVSKAWVFAVDRCMISEALGSRFKIGLCGVRGLPVLPLLANRASEIKPYQTIPAVDLRKILTFLATGFDDMYGLLNRDMLHPSLRPKALQGISVSRVVTYFCYRLLTEPEVETYKVDKKIVSMPTDVDSSPTKYVEALRGLLSVCDELLSPITIKAFNDSEEEDKTAYSRDIRNCSEHLDYGIFKSDAFKLARKKYYSLNLDMRYVDLYRYFNYKLNDPEVAKDVSAEDVGDLMMDYHKEACGVASDHFKAYIMGKILGCKKPKGYDKWEKKAERKDDQEPAIGGLKASSVMQTAELDMTVIDASKNTN